MIPTVGYFPNYFLVKKSTNKKDIKLSIRQNNVHITDPWYAAYNWTVPGLIPEKNIYLRQVQTNSAKCYVQSIGTWHQSEITNPQLGDI